MFSPHLHKSINWILVVAMLLQPVMAVVPTKTAHAAPAGTAVQNASPDYEVLAHPEALVESISVPAPDAPVEHTAAQPELLQTPEWPPVGANFTVNTTLDGVDSDPGDGDCSGPSGCTLRAAIMEANTLAGAQIIALPGLPEPYTYYTLTLQGTSEDASEIGDLDITGDVALVGENAATTVIDASSLSDRVLHILGGVVTISGVTVRGGYATSWQHGGGGIYNEGDLTLSRSAVTYNSAYWGGGIAGESGSKTTLVNTTISYNTANTDEYGDGGNGGGIAVGGTLVELTITNSTITGNWANGDGGGIWAGGGDSNPPYVSLLNTTIANNGATYDYGSEPSGGGIVYDSEGGGDQVSLENTIVAQNESQNCLVKEDGTPANPSFTSLGHNLSDDGTCNLIESTDLPSTYPLLVQRWTDSNWVLLYGSPAIDAGNNAACPDTDQRGVARPQGEACDIGAYEYQLSIDFTVNSELDIVDYAPGDGECETAPVTRSAPCARRSWKPTPWLVHRLFIFQVDIMSEPSMDFMRMPVQQATSTLPTISLSLERMQARPLLMPTTLIKFWMLWALLRQSSSAG